MHKWEHGGAFSENSILEKALFCWNCKEFVGFTKMKHFYSFLNEKEHFVDGAQKTGLGNVEMNAVFWKDFWD